MTTTRIYFEPYASATFANGYATYDLEGSVKDSALNEYLETNGPYGHSRINNNTYRWVSSGGVPNGSSYETFTIKLDATNWPLESNASNLIYNTVSYTFPSGNSIPAAQQGISVKGRYISERAYNFGDNGLVRYTLQSHQGNTATITARTDDLRQPENIGFPLVSSEEVTKQYSPYATYYITSTQALTNYFETGTTALVNYFDGDYAGDYVADQNIGGYVLDDYLAPEISYTLDDTRTNVKFFVHSIQGHSGGGGETSLDVRYEYEYRLIWQVNLHSVTATITSVSTFANTLAGMALVGSTTETIETTATATGTQIFGAQASAVITNTVTAVPGFLVGGEAQDATIQTAFAVGDAVGIIQPAAAAADIVSVWPDTEPVLQLGFTGSLEVESECLPIAENIIDIGDGQNYIAADYAEPGYFTLGTGLTLFTDSTIVSVDANVIRSDGTILFEGDFAATIQPGFQIDAGIITEGDAAFEISPYTTAGTGLLFAAAAELQQQAQTVFIAGGQVVAEATALLFDSSLAVLSSPVRFGETAIDLFRLTLSSDSESRPSILATIDLLDGTGSLTATALVDQSSGVRPEIDFTLAVVAGYTVFANASNTIGINADFASEGRIYYIDEYYMSLVTPESRLLSVQSELESLIVDSETRVNTSLVENRGLVVEPETRTAKPELLPTTLQGARLRRIPV